MARKQVLEEKAPVTQEMIDKCLAWAVAEGDIVNFRFLFVPFSPLRQESTEDINTAKYAYLRPRDENAPRYREALALADTVEMHAFVNEQLEKEGLAQLPSELLLKLADNAVRLGKYSSASQAYELLRVRRRMQEEFYRQGDAALDADDVPTAVYAYRAAVGLDYDYAAFPEPMPMIPNFQTRALMLHAEYPMRPEDSVPLQAPEAQLSTALNYLLLAPEAAGRLLERPMPQRLAFLRELVRSQDPGWDTFRARYKEACALVRSFGERLQREANRDEKVPESLEEEIAEQQEQGDPRQIAAALLGREIPQGEWWQYLKELAYEHPAAVLFISRQVVLRDLEILMPRFRTDSPLIAALEVEAE